MKVACIGGGPGGLYAALLLKRADPSRHVVVHDRNPRGTTYGWGVVFSDETLGFLQDADVASYLSIRQEFVHWTAIDIVRGNQCLRSDGHAFSGLARHRLLDILQTRCLNEGVELVFESTITSLEQLLSYDLCIIADGVNSTIREQHAARFEPSFDEHASKYIWFGCELPLQAFSFVFRDSPFGTFQIHAYPFSSRLSTVIVETDSVTWQRSGLDVADTETTIAFCEELFSDFLDGHPLLSNRSSWISFVTLKNTTWRMGRTVLLGDAAHTAHFSVGSGTKMAMEDAIALAAALDRDSRLEEALVEYEELRQPLVERTQIAARDSANWFEHVRRYASFEAPQFAFSLLTRSKRVTHANLELRDPEFMETVDRWFAGHGVPGTRVPVPAEPPWNNPLDLASLHVRNRLVAAPHCLDSAFDGRPGSVHAARLLAAGLVGAGLTMAVQVSVSSHGRITSGSAGLYDRDHVDGWSEIVKSVHAHSDARLGMQLVHAGPRGATRPRTEGTDLPLSSASWPLIAASAIPYLAGNNRPKQMDDAAMTQVCQEFRRAAALADEVGFDLVEIEAGRGYLLASFLSPLTNRRTDHYGGPIENRLRFPLEVVSAIRAVWPARKPLSVSFSALDWARGGVSTEDALTIADALRGAGADLLHVGSGGTTAGANPPYARAWQVPLSDLIRNEVGVATLVSGAIRTADEANTILVAGRADLCIVSDRMLSNPMALFAPEIVLT